MQPPVRALLSHGALGPWSWAVFIGQEPGAVSRGSGSSWDMVLSRPSAVALWGGGAAVRQAVAASPAECFSALGAG